jgi:lysophospholipase L1-like esterase
MNKIFRIFTFFLLCIFALQPLLAQETPPFYSDIRSFKKQDSLHFPLNNAILFVGSSSFTNWVDVQDYFRGYTIINRGFGGSSLPDVIRYVDDIIFPYNSKQIVIYCGENDLAASDTVTANMVFSRFTQLFDLIRNRFPKVSIAYISMKPSPSRIHLMHKMTDGNLMIKDFLKNKNNTAFIDVYHKMLSDDGTPMKNIFNEDSLHMNAKGYAIWKKAIEPYLLKN